MNCSNVTFVSQGDYFVCECKGTNGNPPADVTWYKNNAKIVTGKEIVTLVLSDVGKDDNGTYRCEAKSGIDKAKNESLIKLFLNCKYNTYITALRDTCIVNALMTIS